MTTQAELELLFFNFVLAYLNIPYVPCFHTIACEPCSAISANRYQMGRTVSYITEHDIPHTPPPRALGFTGAERPLTVSHSETPSCAWRCGLVQTTVSSLQARFQTCHFCFPWHGATKAVLVSFCVLTTATLLCSALLQSSFHFPKTNLGPGPSRTVTPLMGESLNVHA